MEIRFAGKQLKLTQGMRDHAREKLLKLEHYAPKLIDAHVVLIKEKYLFKAEITVLAKNLRAYGEATCKENIYTAIDQACDRVEKQLKKYREKLKTHHKVHGEHFAPVKEKTVEIHDRSSENEEDILPIVRSDDQEIKPMSVEEARLQLEVSRKTFIVFYNASSKRVNVLYRREDGDLGLIEPDYL